jgi:hypothetical protein
VNYSVLSIMIKMSYLVECVVLIRPHRLTVRTSDSQSGNSGSIPGGVTIRDLIIKRDPTFIE